jgi:hypothetical protein
MQKHGDRLVVVAILVCEEGFEPLIFAVQGAKRIAERGREIDTGEEIATFFGARREGGFDDIGKARGLAGDRAITKIVYDTAEGSDAAAPMLGADHPEIARLHRAARDAHRPEEAIDARGIGRAVAKQVAGQRTVTPVPVFTSGAGSWWCSMRGSCCTTSAPKTI